MRQNIHVISFQDLQFTLFIEYKINGKPKNMIIDKEKNTQLMELYSGKLNQYDAICMADLHESELEMKGYLDLTKPESLFEPIANICRNYNKSLAL